MRINESGLGQRKTRESHSPVQEKVKQMHSDPDLFGKNSGESFY